MGVDNDDASEFGSGAANKLPPLAARVRDLESRARAPGVASPLPPTAQMDPRTFHPSTPCADGGPAQCGVPPPVGAAATTVGVASPLPTAADTNVRGEHPIATAADDCTVPCGEPPRRDIASSPQPARLAQVSFTPENRARTAWESVHNNAHAIPASGTAAPQQAPTAMSPQYTPAQTPTDAPTPGGPIVSPRRGDHEEHARRLGVSRFDIVRLATPDYHWGAHGVQLLTHAILAKCGYNQIPSSDIVTCHNDIIAVHRRVRDLWYNPTTHTYGPQVERIMSKSLKLLPMLDLASTETMVEFYDHLQEAATGLAIAIMPFDSVMIRNGLEGLCVLGLGVDRYLVMSKALMELLPRLVPGTLSPQINAALASVRSESGNGYDYLWRVLELTVPGFDPVIPIQVPQWLKSDDIFSFA